MAKKKPRTSFEIFMDGVFDELNGTTTGGFYTMGREATTIALAFKKWMKKP